MGLNTLHCAACGSPLAVTRYEYSRPEYFCDERCAKGPRLRQHQERDDLIRELHRKGKTLEQIGGIFNLTHQRVSQIVKEPA